MFQPKTSCFMLILLFYLFFQFTLSDFARPGTEGKYFVLRQKRSPDDYYGRNLPTFAEALEKMKEARKMMEEQQRIDREAQEQQRRNDEIEMERKKEESAKNAIHTKTIAITVAVIIIIAVSVLVICIRMRYAKGVQSRIQLYNQNRQTAPPLVTNTRIQAPEERTGMYRVPLNAPGTPLNAPGTQDQGRELGLIGFEPNIILNSNNSYGHEYLPVSKVDGTVNNDVPPSYSEATGGVRPS